MAVFQGAPLPNITETTKKLTETPQFYTDYLSGLSQAGATALGKTPDQLVAPLTALQQQGYAAVPGAAEAYRPQLATAQQTAGQAAGVGAEDISRFMDPYTQNVVQEMERLAQQNIQRNVMPSLTAGAVGRGDLGSRRYASSMGQSLSDIQRNLTGQQYGALSSGYKSALDAAMAEAQLQNQVARTQAEQAKMEQELGLSGAKAMTTAGKEQQEYEQALLESPLKTATGVSKLMQGQTLPVASTQTFTGPKAGAYQTSGMQNIALTGLSSVLAAQAANKAAPEIATLLKSLGIKGSGPQGSYTEKDILQAQQEAQNESYWASLLRNESVPTYWEPGGGDYNYESFGGGSGTFGEGEY